MGKKLSKKSSVALNFKILPFKDNFQINIIEKMYRASFPIHNIHKFMPKMHKKNIYNRLNKLFETEEHLRLAKQLVYHNDLFYLGYRNNLTTKKHKKENDVNSFILSFQATESGQIKTEITKSSSKTINVTALHQGKSNELNRKDIINLKNLGHTKDIRKTLERKLKHTKYQQNSKGLKFWFFYLNFESLYGEPTREEAFSRLFKRALICQNPKKIFVEAINICVRNGMQELCNTILKSCCEKYAHSAKVWLRILLYRINNKEYLEADNVLRRALKATPRQKHANILTKFALILIKSGDFTRGRKVLENMLCSFQNRLDLWSIYMDQMIKHCELIKVREVFEILLAKNLLPKTIKSIYKRYINYDYNYGIKVNIDHLRIRAMKYVTQQVCNIQDKYEQKINHKL